MELNFASVLRFLPYLLSGALTSLWLAAIGSLFGMILGAALAAAKIYGPLPLRWLANAYIEIWRNTPLIVQLFIFFFGLPSLGIALSPIVAAVLVFVLNAAGYMAEIIRGGIAAVSHGQYEAARALALTPWQTFRHVILPPATKAAAPALGNHVILVTLATSQASLIAVDELTYRATILDARLFRSFETYLVTLAIYFVLARLLIALLQFGMRRVFRQNTLRNIPQL